MAVTVLNLILSHIDRWIKSNSYRGRICDIGSYQINIHWTDVATFPDETSDSHD